MDRRAPLMGLLWDIGLPAAVYYVSRWAGVEVRPALVAGGAVALARVGFIAVARRRLDGLGAVVAVTFALVLAVSVLTGDPRILLAREPLVSGSLGLLLLGSCLLGRPVLYSLVRRLNSGRGELLARWDELWRTTPSFRRVFTLMSLVWGVGLVVEAAVRISLVYLLPVDTAAGTSTLVQLATVVLLGGWSLWYRRRRLRTVASSAAGAEVVRAR
ncbi:VC0807 family protein [Kitasatospora sp. NPDC058965]|uniref:VC0807 family protein n=1 Tax=Kitasatospora sp. NPDC058965 TaxID=3346682 RepID=UPI0036AB5DFC